MQLSRFALVATLAAAVAGRCDARCTDGIEARTIFGTRSSPDTLVTHDKTISVGTDADPVRYFRLELQREPQSTANGVMVVKDDALRVVDVYSLKNLPVGKAVWTRRGTGNTAALRFVVPDGETIAVRVTRTIGMSAKADRNHTYYSVQQPGNERYRPVYPEGNAPGGGSALAKRIADSVGFLHASYDGGQQTWCCSAVAVDTDLVLTNWHCGGDASMDAGRFWDPDVCRQTIVDMSWDGDAESREYRCSGVVADRALDLALLRVSPIDAAAPLVPLRFSDAEVSSGTVGLLHHPECKRKQVTESCQLKGVGPNASAHAVELTHDCDSEGGSSGGALFDASGRLVGLHHAGFRRDETTCQPLDKLNRAIRLPQVKAFVDQARATLGPPVSP